MKTTKRNDRNKKTKIGVAAETFGKKNSETKKTTKTKPLTQ